MVSGGRRYRVKELLGRGGFGVVYRAELLGEGGFVKPVALKLLDPKKADVEEVCQRFRDEARMLGMLQHDAVVGVLGLLRLGGQQAVAMELVEGADLSQLLAQAPLPPRPALEIVARVADALEAAWSQPGPDGRPLRLVHRDIKPANIRVTPRGEVKLLDFGVARADLDAREAETQAMAFGTLEFMAPERLERVMQGRPSSEEHPSGDIYALGVTLLRALTRGKLRGPSFKPTRHRAAVIEALDVVWEGVGPGGEELVRLLEQTLAFSAAERPSPEELERRAALLAASMPGPRLRDWAPTAVGAVRTAREHVESGGLTGVTLVEEVWSPPALPAPPAKVASRPRSPGWTLGVGGLIGAGLAVLLAVLITWRTPSQASPPREPGAGEPHEERVIPVRPPRRRATTPPPGGTEADAVQGASADRLAASEAAPPTARRPETGRPEPSGPPASSEPEPRPASLERPLPEAPKAAPVEALGRVVVPSPPAQLELIDDAGRAWPPGEVPPGHYRVLAAFEEGAPLDGVGELTLSTSGSTLTLRCDPRFHLCKAD